MPNTATAASPTAGTASASALEQVPLTDLRLRPEDVAAVEATLRSGWLTQGPRVAELEGAFAGHLGVAHAVAVSSCTAALHLSYLAAGVGPGDEVIVPAYTFAATASAVVQAGGTPVFADVVGPHDLSIDPDDVVARITPRTRAVAAVHFAGFAAPVQRLRELCDARGLALIEDVAHAPLAHVDGRALGSFGLAGAFSFFSNKVLACGEGGLLATDDADVAAAARRQRSQSMSSGTWERHRGLAPSYDVADAGFNYRFDEPRAALLLSRLEVLAEDVAARRERTRRYRARLTGHDTVLVPYADALVPDSTCYVMAVLVDPEVRDELRVRLRERHGVQTSLFYPPVHRFTAYRERFGEVSLPWTEACSAAEVTLPLFPHLTDVQQDRVVDGLLAELDALGARPAEAALAEARR